MNKDFFIKEYLNHPETLELKDLGFDEPCLNHW